MSLLSQMLGLLTSAYNKTDEYNAEKGLPLETEIGRLFAIICWGLEKIESNAHSVREWSDIDKAQGRVLDRYGANYGVSRGGADNRFYRLMIKVKMIAQLSCGDIDTVINAVSVLYDIEPVYVELNEVFLAKIRVLVDDGQLTEEKRELSWLINKLTKRIVAAGVGFDIYIRVKRSVHATIYAAALANNHNRHETPAITAWRARSRKIIYAAAVANTYSRHRTGGADNYG